MAKSDIENQEQTLKKIEEIEARVARGVKIRLKTQEKLNELQIKNLKLGSQDLSLGKKINLLEGSSLKNANKLLGLDKQISTLKDFKNKGTKEELKQANKLADIMAGVVSGNKDFSDAINELATEDFGLLNGSAVKFAKTLADGGEELEKSTKRSAKFGNAFDDIKEKVKDFSEILRSPQAMGAAVIGFIVKEMVEFAQTALEVRQSLGASAVDSAKIAGNMKLAGMNAKRFGGSVVQGEAAVTSLVDEFGSMSVISVGVSARLGLITGQFGLSGDNAGKLLKTMQGINGASIETNLATLETVGNLARASRVAPAAVLNDMAESTETFAKFARNGGENLARAAIEARKLGLNLSTVDKIAESIMDIEGSIANEMEASMLLGRQLSLDRARQLVMEGDMAGVLEEVKNQAGGAAEFAAMDFVQRKALAAAVGLEVSELAKLTSEQEAAVEAQEKQAKGAMKLAMGIGAIVGLAAALVPAILASIPGLQGVGLRGLAKGLGVAAAGAAGGAVLGAGVGTVMGMEKGGVVKKSGLAEVHKGEVFSGTRNEMGMGNGKTNKLLRELINQNEMLMNKLTQRVGDIALSNIT